MSLQAFLRESTWGYPVISAIHVLSIAWFGGTILIQQFGPELKRLRQAGIALAVITGVILFGLHPAQYSHSHFFQLKILLLICVLCTKPGTRLSTAFWISIIFASRGIAFW